MAINEFFTWGAGGTKKTPEQVAREREIAESILMRAGNTSPVGHWTQGAARIVDALGGVLKERRAAAGEADIASRNKTLIASLLGGGSPASAAPVSSSAIPMTSAAGEMAATSPTQPIDMTGNEVYNEFIGAAREGGLTNPFGLAALAATGKAESGFSPGNVNRTWSDPSQSGQPGTAGGILSWRGPRYEALAATGDLSPRGQGNFFIQENPQLITALNNANSIEEAQSLINNAWQFAGFDRPGGEAARRLQLARGFLPSFQGAGEVAASTPEAAIEAVSPLQPAPEAAMSFAGQERAPPVSLSDEVAAYQQTPEYAAVFPGRQQPAQAAAAAPVQVAGGGDRVPMASQSINPAIIEALTDPQASPQTQRIAGILLEQQQAKQQALQGEENWRARQQYEQEILAQDPLRQAQIQKLQREAANPNGDETFFGNAVPYKDAQGNIRMGQLGNRGTFRPVPLEEGASFAPTTRSVDTGTEILTVGPGGEILDRVAKQTRQEESEKALGSAEGKAKAETRGEYESITSKMPGLYGVVGRLDKLAETATYTMTGQGVDWIRNQVGLDPRQGAIDRAEYTAVVDNQILPLLKDTFGAQFTAEEGQRLARTLGDPDKSPVEKQALLRAFIQQKERDIQALGSRIGETPPAGRSGAPQSGNEVQTDIPGVKIRRKN